MQLIPIVHRTMLWERVRDFKIHGPGQFLVFHTVLRTFAAYYLGAPSHCLSLLFMQGISTAPFKHLERHMATGQFWPPMKRLNILFSNLCEVRFTAIGGRMAYTGVRYDKLVKAVYWGFVGHVWYMSFKLLAINQ